MSIEVPSRPIRRPIRVAYQIGTRPLKDPRPPKRPEMPYFRYLQELRES